MINLIQATTTLQFIIGSLAFASGIMIILQLAVRRSVWTPYVLAFVASVIILAATLR